MRDQRRTRKGIAAFLVLSVLLAGCSKPRQDGETSKDRTVEPEVDCDTLLSELRSIRTGVQPCTDDDDCTTWPQAEHWDGCPTEVNLDSADKLTELRRRLEEGGCVVDRGAACAPMAMHGCGNGRCGRPAALGQKLGKQHQLTDQQMQMLSERVKDMMKATGLKPTADAGTSTSPGETQDP